MTVREELDELRGIVRSLAASVVKHDDQIEALLQIAEKQQAQMTSTEKAVAALERQWQAYLRTLPKN